MFEPFFSLSLALSKLAQKTRIARLTNARNLSAIVAFAVYRFLYWPDDKLKRAGHWLA